MSDTVERVKEKLSIVDVVSPYVKLTRAGKYWKGISPFNKEKTPSFFVSPDRGLYHCFSSGKGGDMFTFIQEMEGMDFKGALKLLADKAGVPLVYEKGSADDREKLFEALRSAQEFFAKNLEVNADAKRYLESRGVKSGSLESWSLGYALPEWRSLHAHLSGIGFTDGIMERAGLVKKPDRDDNAAANDRVYDRFRGRIVFPIRDISGRVIGFSGRIFPDTGGQEAKYLNSPETPLFDKSRALHGIDVAREGIRALNSVILVEGQLDLLMSHQAGYKNTVATSGTSFTERHAELLKRYTPNLLIAYDGDRAGIAAAGRAAAIALRAGMNVKVAKLPAGEDPADLIKKDAESFKAVVREALHVVDFYIAHITDAKYDPRTFRLEVSRTVLPYVAMIENKIDQAHFMQKVGEVLSVPEEAVKAELKKLIQPQQTKPQSAAAPDPRSEPFLSRADSIERLVMGLVLLFKEEGKAQEAGEAEQILKETVGEERYIEILQKKDETRGALFEADLFLTGRDHAESIQALTDLYADLKREVRHEKYREAVSALRVAEKSGKEDDAAAIMQELSTLARNLE